VVQGAANWPARGRGCLNAGVGIGGLFWQTDLEAELNMVYLNCAGTVQLAKYVVQEMVNRGTGRILFTASIAGEMVAPREAVYAATKGLRALIRAQSSLRVAGYGGDRDGTAARPDRY
jgi:short-subunit dehydrogenase